MTALPALDRLPGEAAVPVLNLPNALTVGRLLVVPFFAVALLVDKAVAPADALTIKRDLVAAGQTVRMQRRTKNVTGLLEQLAASGATQFAFVRPGDAAATLDVKPIG